MRLVACAAVPVGCVAIALSCGACGGGRTPLLPPACEPKVTPSALDFGEVAAGQAVDREVRIGNQGGADCVVSDIRLDADSDVWFSLSPATPSAAVVSPGAQASFGVTFAPAGVATPLTRTGGLGFVIDPPHRRRLVIPMTAKIRTDCHLAISPSAIDFGHVALDTAVTEAVTITNTGIDPCEVSDVRLAAGSDPQFSLPSPPAGVVALQAGEGLSVAVTFHATQVAKPRHRTGNLRFTTTDDRNADAVVPLSADIDVGCELAWTPASIDFGNVILNNTVGANVMLRNDGTGPCQVSDVGLARDSDGGFRLADGQPTSFALEPESQAAIGLTFTAADSAPPHKKTGTLTFATGNSRNPSAAVPLAAYIDTVCVEASRWIYTLDQSGMLSRFDPSTLTFADIGYLDCPSGGPNSMAVDQNAVAWVNYTDGSLFKVDTSNAHCEKTSFAIGQHNLYVFGMGSVFDPATGVDTLYVAGGRSLSASDATLATISFPDLVVHPIGLVTAGFPELSGTGDGTLWGFIPAGVSTSGQSVLVRIDPASAKVLETHAYDLLDTSQGWAMKFWGGSFWVFLSTAVYEVPRATPDVIHTALSNTGRVVVGAGVSTCAPL